MHLSAPANHPHSLLYVCLRAVLDQNLFDDDSFLYEQSPDLLRFRTANPSIELLTDWYQSRAQDIDSCSRQVQTVLGDIMLHLSNVGLGGGMTLKKLFSNVLASNNYHLEIICCLQCHLASHLSLVNDRN